jgi:pimeloyl-ACP methyl ester carboxylesterase
MKCRRLAAALAAGVLISSVPALADDNGSGRLVEIAGGRKLYIECRGTGRPTVILQSGYRNNAAVWSAHEPGDPVPQPRTALEIADEMHALLRTAQVPGPYVLVGHSFGGLFVRLYASLHPGKVAGLVEVDALNEFLEPLLTPDEWDYYDQINTDPPPGIGDYPELEVIDFRGAFAQMRQAERLDPLRRMPIVVLSKGRSFEFPPGVPQDFQDALNRAWATSQDHLARHLPHGRHILARRSAHFIQIDQPGLVIRAIRQVVKEVRGH